MLFLMGSVCADVCPKCAEDVSRTKHVSRRKVFCPGKIGYHARLSGKTARYVQVQVSDPGSYYFGMGEVQVFSKLPSPPKSLMAKPVSGTPDIEVSWSNPSVFDQIVVMRKPGGNASGSPYNYPWTTKHGDLVYQGTGHVRVHC